MGRSQCVVVLHGVECCEGGEREDGEASIGVVSAGGC